jgi:hypothetical protein
MLLVEDTQQAKKDDCMRGTLPETSAQQRAASAPVHKAPLFAAAFPGENFLRPFLVDTHLEKPGRFSL